MSPNTDQLNQLNLLGLGTRHEYLLKALQINLMCSQVENLCFMIPKALVFSVVSGQTVSASRRNFLEVQNLSPTPDIPNQKLHFNKMPCDLYSHWSLRSTAKILSSLKQCSPEKQNQWDVYVYGKI